MTIKVSGKIRRVDGREISYPEFRDKYMKANEPVLLTGLMDDWRACRDWVSPDGQPNLSFFSLNFAKSRVQVADCDRKEFTDQKRLGMTVAEYIEYWHNLNSRFYDTDCDGNRNYSSVLYLKDWHFVKEYPDYNAYTTPTFFLDDWLNLYLDSYRIHGIEGVDEDCECDVSCSDYRFVYMGPKGTWTPLHADVFRSYSWSANVCGKKVWHFLSPSQSHLLYDRNLLMGRKGKGRTRRVAMDKSQVLALKESTVEPLQGILALPAVERQPTIKSLDQLPKMITLPVEDGTVLQPLQGILALPAVEGQPSIKSLDELPEMITLPVEDGTVLQINKAMYAEIYHKKSMPCEVL